MVLASGALAVVVICTLVPGWLAPANPLALSNSRLMEPSAKWLLGSDSLGRDVLSRIIYGARISLEVGFAAAATATVAGLIFGAVAGLSGGFADVLVMRAAEIFQMFPAFILAVLIVALMSPGIFGVILVIALLAWPETARLARNEAQRTRDLDYVNAARCLGIGAPRIMFVEVIPNILSPVLAMGTLVVAQAIVIEAGLSFLGLGPSNLVTWGSMLNEGRRLIFQGWWLSVFPGIAIFITVISLNIVGDYLMERARRQ